MVGDYDREAEAPGRALYRFGRGVPVAGEVGVNVSVKHVKLYQNETAGAVKPPRLGRWGRHLRTTSLTLAGPRRAI